MLLNQCLAISLSPLAVADEYQQQQDDKAAIGSEQKQDFTAEDNLRGSRRQSDHWALFRQLVDRNLEPVQGEAAVDEDEQELLREALKRVDFAGFVVPSWLLLSGSYNDLHCIKWSWSEGNFKPPPGFKIETIGNIRSVNVDYFGFSNSSQQQVNQLQENFACQQTETIDNQNKQISAAQQLRLSRLQSHQEQKQAASTTPLESVLLDTIIELSQRSEDPVHANHLAKYLRERHQFEESVTGELIESLERLASSGRVKLKPIDRQQSKSPSQQQPAVIGRAEPHNRVGRVSSASTNKSKSTTLDSGIQSWDPVSSPSNEPGGATMLGRHHDVVAVGLEEEQVLDRAAEERVKGGRRGFSLSRSFSFKSKKSPAQAADRWLQQQQPQQRDLGAKEEENGGKLSRNLTSLFRSKSMRTISANRSRGANWQATNGSRAVHLNNCDRPPRGVSSHLASAREYRQVTIDYLTTAQPRKRAFSTRRNSLLAFNTSANKEELTTGKIVLFLRKLFTIKRLQTARQPSASAERTIERHILGSPAQPVADQSPATTRSAACQSPEARPKLANNHISSASPSSQSSGSSSLIEILDCAPAIDNSRRSLREVSAPRALTSRSTWRLSKRSGSSLSNNSQASCSTAKSTVSQQLRRHLDEAYKRHRNCTSQREKEFIDSINVLRQASRHALQNSRSSSKNHQAKSVGTKSATSDTGSSLGGSSCATSRQERRQQVPCQCKRVYGDHQLEVDDDQDEDQEDSNNNNGDYQHSDLNGDTALLDGVVDVETESLDERPSAKYLADWSELRNVDQSNANLFSNCCLCSSYLSESARLCPLSCCPGAPLTCCLGSLHRHQPQNHLQPGDLSEGDLCCPLWRSMLYNYCHPPMADLQLPAIPRPDQLSRLENFSSKHQVQQHQHNTTIDLKIEIGALLDKQRQDGSGGRDTTTTLTTSSTKPSDGDDSLNSDELIDEPLNKLQDDDAEFEPDSYESVEADSLRGQQAGLEDG